MKSYIHTFILLLVSTISLSAQVDSSYIEAYQQDLSIKVMASKSFLQLSLEDNKLDKQQTYMPNNPAALGLGFTWRNTAISFGYSHKFNFLRDRKLGDTKASDFQLHNYGRKYVFDIFIQKYKGFYDGDDQKTLYPDLKIKQYGAFGQYVFNGNKYSSKAAFNHGEKQLKSAGSFLLGGGVYNTKIESDSSFIYNDEHKLRNFQFGVSIGYGYTWVLGRHWLLSVSTTTGIQFGAEKFNKITKKLEVYPTAFPRGAVSYNHDTWSIAASYINNITFSSMSDDKSIGQYTGNFQLSFIKRFASVPILSKK